MSREDREWRPPADAAAAAAEEGASILEQTFLSLNLKSSHLRRMRQAEDQACIARNMQIFFNFNHYCMQLYETLQPRTAIDASTLRSQLLQLLGILKEFKRSTNFIDTCTNLATIQCCATWLELVLVNEASLCSGKGINPSDLNKIAKCILDLIPELDGYSEAYCKKVFMPGKSHTSLFKSMDTGLGAVNKFKCQYIQDHPHTEGAVEALYHEVAPLYKDFQYSYYVKLLEMLESTSSHDGSTQRLLIRTLWIYLYEGMRAKGIMNDPEQNEFHKEFIKGYFSDIRHLLVHAIEYEICNEQLTAFLAEQDNFEHLKQILINVIHIATPKSDTKTNKIVFEQAKEQLKFVFEKKIVASISHYPGDQKNLLKNLADELKPAQEAHEYLIGKLQERNRAFQVFAREHAEEIQTCLKMPILLPDKALLPIHFRMLEYIQAFGALYGALFVSPIFVALKKSLVAQGGNFDIRNLHPCLEQIHHVGNSCIIIRNESIHLSSSSRLGEMWAELQHCHTRYLEDLVATVEEIKQQASSLRPARF